MNPHAEFLACLEQARCVDANVLADELRGCAEQFAARRWIIRQGYQTSILVPVLNTEEEVEVAVDEERGTYSYRSLAHPKRFLTRPLEDISTYAFCVDSWLDAIAEMLDIENAHRARRRDIIDGHLWHLGEVRVGRTHQFAPIYIARRLAQCAADWRQPMLDAARSGHGIVITASDLDGKLPNGHQQCGLNTLLISDANGVVCDRDVMNRLLRGVQAERHDTDEWFDERTGALKLHHMTAPKVFSGEKQKAVIAAFWRGRHESSIKWSDVVARTGCGRDPDSVFGKKVWREWLESPGHGHYRLRLWEQHRS